MSESKEFLGKTLDAAIAEACAYYDVPREKLEIDIIEDAKTGIFGIVGARKAKIHARLATLPDFMQLYKTYKVNPMGGCLPILIQLPVFVALYQALLNCIELRHASFITYLPGTDLLWLADLSVKDPFYITPLVMGATMFLQQWLSPAMGDPSQRKVMMIMPVVFTVMFINFPSGLVLYWLCNNVLSIAQQAWTLRNK